MTEVKCELGVDLASRSDRELVHALIYQPMGSVGRLMAERLEAALNRVEDLEAELRSIQGDLFI